METNNQNTFATTIFLLLLFGLVFTLYLIFKNPIHSGGSLIFTYSFFLIFLPILFVITLTKRRTLSSDEIQSKKLAAYLALSTIFLLLFFIRTNTILLNKIPYWDRIQFPDWTETTRYTQTHSRYQANQPDRVEIILDASGSMKEPTYQDFIGQFTTDTKGFKKCQDPQYQVDTDGDNLIDCFEKLIKTDPNNPDTDGDGKSDGEEFRSIQDPLGNKQFSVELKIDQAKQTLTEVIDTLPNDLEVGLRIYSGNITKTQGLPGIDSCQDSQLVVPIKPVDKTMLKQQIQQIKPTGSTPLAYSLQMAENDFTTSETLHQTIILVTDGVETCKGDPCAVAKDIHSRGRVHAIDVIGIDIMEGSEDKVSCIAENGGGQYYSVSSMQDFESSFKNVIGIKTWQDKLKQLISLLPWWLYLLIPGSYFIYRYIKTKRPTTINSSIPTPKHQSKSSPLLSIVNFLKNRKKELAVLLALVIWWQLHLSWFWLIIIFLPVLWYFLFAKPSDKQKISQKSQSLKQAGRKTAASLGQKLINLSKKK